MENPTTENPTSDNPTQINKEEQRTDFTQKKKNQIRIYQIPIPFPILSPNPSPLGDDAAEPQERKRKEAAAQSAFEIYEEIIKDNIEYDILKQNMPYDYDRLDEIVDLMLETVCTRRKTIRIAGDDYPAELVKAKFMKLDSEHIRFVLDCMREKTQPKSAISSSIYGRCCSMPRPLSATITLPLSLTIWRAAHLRRESRSLATRTITHATRAKACKTQRRTLYETGSFDF